MQLLTATLASLAALAALAAAQATQHRVDVGLSGLVFTPSQITANVGDTVLFTFHPRNHSVTQSAFATPCAPITAAENNGTDGFNSGFMPVAANTTTDLPTFTLPVNSTTPVWIHCAQVGHCPAGMVFAINPTADQTFAAFLANAEGSSSGAPSASSSAPAGSSTSSSTSTSTSSYGSATTSAPANSGASTTGRSLCAVLVLVGLVAVLA